MLADFLIGAHAAVAGFGLVSRDEGYRRTFTLELLNPAEQEAGVLRTVRTRPHDFTFRARI